MISPDAFDRLPDPLLLHIFNNVRDIKALGRCCAVSKRFNAVVPQVEELVVKVDCIIPAQDRNLAILKRKGFFTHLLRAIVGSLVKPVHALQLYLAPKKNVLTEVYHQPEEVLKNFNLVRHLKIELPGGELGVEDGVLLKWRAEFGSTLESCVILSASSVEDLDKQVRRKSSRDWLEEVSSTELEQRPEIQDNTDSIQESFYSNGGLKLRVVWTISSLIAASARHYLLQQIISDHPTLESLVLSDANDQGTLHMGKEQLREFRDKPIAASPSSKRTQVPALNMKLWHAPCLDLPGGGGSGIMKGATLVTIRPRDQPLDNQDTQDFVCSAFEEPLKSAARSLIRRRTYLLEMNSF